MNAPLPAPAPPDVTLAARAKINLFLEVYGRRPDGYHEVATLMHTVSLHDTVAVELSGQDRPGCIEVICRPDRQLSGPRNLAYRAAAAYLSALCGCDGCNGPAAGRSLSVRVAIDKRIPVAAGLAGGSADAAATLRGLAPLTARLRPQPSPLPALGPIAAALGADVPFCLTGGAAWGTGRGDQLTPVLSILRGPVLIVAPPFAVASRDAYAWWDEDHGAQHVPAWSSGCPGGPDRAGRAGTRPDRLDTPAQVAALVQNDLRPPVVRRHPVVGEILTAIRDCGAQAAEMSGSGPAVFGLFSCTGQAAEAARRLAAAFPGARVLPAALDPVETPPGSGREEPSGGGAN